MKPFIITFKTKNGKTQIQREYKDFETEESILESFKKAEEAFFITTGIKHEFISVDEVR